jgi:phosphate transport system substrate-binding protein
MTFWMEEFRKQYPGVNTQMEGKGSNTAPPALMAGIAQLAPMSRDMKPAEMDDFEKKFGYKPTKIRVSVDALAVFVNKDNPIKGLDFTQVDAIFSKTLLMKAPKSVETWGDLGLTGDWAGHPISLYGRNSASGTYLYFKDHCLKKGDFKDSVKEQPGTAGVVQGVTTDQYGIGYGGIGYITPGVKAIPLAVSGGNYVEATAVNCYNSTYPLSRYLNIYINKAPGKPLDPLVKEFIKFVLSKQGQQIVVKDGYYPILSDNVMEDLKKLD